MKVNSNYFPGFRFAQVTVLSFLLLGCGSSSFVSVSTQSQQYHLRDGQAENEEIDSFVSPYRDSLDRKVKKILAQSEAELTIGRPGRDLYPSQVALGNFMTDAILNIARQKAKELNMPAPGIALFTWGSFRKSLPAGVLTLRNIFELMPFENEMVVMKLSGTQMITLLTQVAGNFNPVAGVTMKQNHSSSIKINGGPIQEDSFYYVLASDYHAFGGDNMAVLLEAAERYYCGIKIRDAVVLYLQQLTQRNQTLIPDYEPRIRN